MAAEYLSREGYSVEIGPGRDDGNIDIRCWTDEKQAGLPPTLLVQCKRQKEKVGKVVVKATLGRYAGGKCGIGVDCHDECSRAGRARCL